MLIKQEKRSPVFLRSLRKLFNRNLLLFLLVIALLITGTLFWISRKYGEKLRLEGYAGITDFVVTVTGNYAKGLWANTPDMVIDLKHKHFQKLAWKRQQALERGLIVNDDDSWVPAYVRWGNRRYDVEMRLKGHMPDHIKGEKWSFRIKIEGEGNIFGTRRFSLQHPGTRGYINEWIYHQLQRREGVIALNYHFVDLTLNGKDLGIYAFEENFDTELPSNNQRPEGPLMRFAPDLYWVYRLREVQGYFMDKDYGTFSASVLEPYRFNATLEDPSMRSMFIEAQDLMKAFLDQQLPATKVFDIDRMATFHAIIDLVGGHHSLDWSDVKFYYNSHLQRLEPVAYESFGVYPTRNLAGAYKFEQDSTRMRNNYYHLLFSDTTFFKRYVSEVNRLSEPGYLDSFFNGVSSDLEQNLNTLYREFPYKKFRKDVFYENQRRMKLLLTPPDGVRAFISATEEGRVKVQYYPVSSLPINVLGIFNGNQFVPFIKPLLTAPKKPGEMAALNEITLDNLPFRLEKNDSMQFAWQVLGTDTVLKDELRPHPAPASSIQVQADADLNSFPFLRIDSVRKEIRVLPGNWTFTDNIVIDEGWVLNATENTVLNFKGGASLISYSPVNFKGHPENRIELNMSPGSTVQVREAGQLSRLSNVSIFSEAGDSIPGTASSLISFYISPVQITNSTIVRSGAENAITFFNSAFKVSHTVITDVDHDAIDAKFSSGEITSCSFIRCGEDALDFSNSQVQLNEIFIDSTGNTGINAKALSKVTLNKADISRTPAAVVSEDESDVVVEIAEIKASKKGLVTVFNKAYYGPASISARGVRFIQVDQTGLRARGTSLTINGDTIPQHDAEESN